MVAADRGVDFVCECADESCAVPLTLSLDEYDAVRGDAASFAVAPGHVYPEVEDVVAATAAYVVVRKFGAGRRVAEAAGRRSAPA